MEEKKTGVIEDAILNTIKKSLESGALEEQINERVKEALNEAISRSFSWGPIQKAIQKRLEEVLVPAIESYDFRAYNAKLSVVLDDLIAASDIGDTAELLKNFRLAMTAPEIKETTVGEIFREYKDFVASEIDNDGREINYDDEPSYEFVEVHAQIKEEARRSWHPFYEYKVLELWVEGESEENRENLNRTIRLRRWRDGGHEFGFEIAYDSNPSVFDLKYMTSFDTLLVTLAKNRVTVNLDFEEREDELEPNDTPEASWR